MTQPPPRDRDQGAEPGRGEGLRDPRLAGFAHGGEWDRRAPGPELASVLAQACGPEWRCPGAEPDELVGVLRRVAAVESWAAAAKLGVIRELIRQDDLPLPNGPRHAGLPGQWSESLTHELALALATSPQAADKLMGTACELASRLPGTGLLLADGTLTLGKAQLIAEMFQGLSDEDAARAEEELLPQLTGPTGKTFGQVERLAAAIAVKVDPGLAQRQRKAAERERSRVQMFRERSGTAALSGRDLPADETLAAYANVSTRTDEYKESGAFPGARLDQLRAIAYLDLLNGVTADARIAHATAMAAAEARAGTGDDPGGQAEPGGWPGPAGGPYDCSCGECDGGCDDPDGGSPDGGNEPGDGPGCDGPDDKGPGSNGPGSGEPGDAGPGDCWHGDRAPGNDEPGDANPGPVGGDPGDAGPDNDAGQPAAADLSADGPLGGGPDDPCPGDGSPCGQDLDLDLDQDQDEVQDQDQDPEVVARPAVADLVIPLLTLLGLAERPGEGHSLGPLDPGLCRDLAATAASWPGSQWCLTITDQDGIAIGHGCAKPARPARTGQACPGKPGQAAARRPGRVPGGAPGPGQPDGPAADPGDLARPRAPARPVGAHAARRPRPGQPRPPRWRIRHLDAPAARRPGPRGHARTGTGVLLRPPARIARLPAE